MKGTILIFGCSLLFCACVGSQNNYGMGFYSNLPYEISETKAYVDGHYFAGAGYLGASSGHRAGGFEHGITEPVPDKITLKWKEPDGSIKEVPVVLKDKVPPHLRGHTIILTITEAGEVDVTLKKNLEVW